MYSVLTAQRLQLKALDAAAKASLSSTDYEIFCAALSVADSTQTPRNQLAHWAWGGCRQKPDLLIVVDPKMLEARDFRVAKAMKAFDSPIKADPIMIAELNSSTQIMHWPIPKPTLSEPYATWQKRMLYSPTFRPISIRPLSSTIFTSQPENRTSLATRYLLNHSLH
jgi:hypothetical protein